MPIADYDAQTSTVTLVTQWNQKSLVTQIPGARWDAQEKIWRVPAAWSSLVIMRGLFGQDLEIKDQLRDWSWRIYNERIGPTLAARNSLELIDDKSPEAEVIKSWRT